MQVRKIPEIQNMKQFNLGLEVISMKVNYNLKSSSIQHIASPLIPPKIESIVTDIHKRAEKDFRMMC